MALTPITPERSPNSFNSSLTRITNKKIQIMKKHIFLTGVLILFFSSCSDFLDYNENSDYDQHKIFNTTWSNTDFVTGIYAYLPGALDDVGGALRSAGCDEAEYVWPTSAIHRYYDGSWSALRTIDDKWTHYYHAIRACNDYLEHGTGKDWKEFEFKKDYARMMRKYRNLEWETKLLRAYYYFELVKRYNRIPLITKVLTEQEANSQLPSDYQTVIDFIVRECDEVSQEGRLPALYNADYDNETGRVSKVFAKALKARALLYAASPLVNAEAETNPAKWIEAARAAKEIIDAAAEWNLSLVPFDRLLGADNYKEPEMILIKRIGDNNDLEKLNFPIGLEGGKSGNCPTQNLVDAFDMKVGHEPNPAAPYANRDPRLACTVLYHGGNTAYGKQADILPNGLNGLPQEGATRTGYYLSKFVNISISLTANSTTTAKHSMPLFRYAEVLLIYAEAMNEAYGPEGVTEELNLSAREALNRVRGRAGLDIAALAAEDVLSKTAFRRALRKERMAELAFEDHRFWDIRRWKIGPETTKIKRVSISKAGEELSFAYSASDDRLWDDKMYFYPIPQAEMYKNPNLVQNPGWEQ